MAKQRSLGSILAEQAEGWPRRHRLGSGWNDGSRKVSVCEWMLSHWEQIRALLPENKLREVNDDKD